MEYLWLIAGFALLVVGADIFVEGSSALAKIFKIPTIIIGLTIVAFGTSLPEASVSVSAAIAGQNGIAISNVLGSNIFNLLVVLGASALIKPVCCQKDSVKKEIPFSILCTFALLGALLLSTGTAINAEGVEYTTYTLGRIGGLVLVALFAFYMYWQISAALKARKNGTIEEETDDGKKISVWKSLIFIVVGIAAIILGGNWVVNGATSIAYKFGMSETLVGMTIVAVGTSLPELVTAITALMKGHGALSLGNIIGANIFNLVLVSGAAIAINPFKVPAEATFMGNNASLIFDIPLVFGVMAVMTLPPLFKGKLYRWQGIALLGIYAAYCVLQFVVLPNFA